MRSADDRGLGPDERDNLNEGLLGQTLTKDKKESG